MRCRRRRCRPPRYDDQRRGTIEAVVLVVVVVVVGVEATVAVVRPLQRCYTGHPVQRY